MKRIGTLKLDLQSWWRNSSGHTDGLLIDDRVDRSADGLPWIPGRTLKGLLRDACFQLEVLEQVKPDTTLKLFGRHLSQIDAEDSQLDGRFLTEEADLRIGSAELGEDWKAWAASLTASKHSLEPDRTAPQILQALFDRRAMTAVDHKTGTAKTGSLRRVEVVTPMELSAPVWDRTTRKDTGDTLQKATGLLRSIGAGRNRGFGRVEMTFSTMEGASA